MDDHMMKFPQKPKKKKKKKKKGRRKRSLRNAGKASDFLSFPDCAV
jgi:hypothetical protein